MSAYPEGAKPSWTTEDPVRVGQQVAKDTPWHWLRYQGGPGKFLQMGAAYTASAEQVFAQYLSSRGHMREIYDKLQEDGYVSDGMDGWMAKNKKEVISMLFWAIRRKGTQEYLPLASSGSARGFTHVEPTDWSVAPPRIFPTPAGAEMALTAWVKGRMTRTRGEHGFFNEPGHSPDVVVSPVEGRNRADFEVIEVRLRAPKIYG